MKQLSLVVLLMALWSLSLYAQEMGDKADSKMKTVTGCLQKGMESGGYTLTAADGKIWELTGETAGLDKHVGHKVMVTGQAVKGTAEEEKKMKASEGQEASGKEQGDLRVTGVKHVSETCP